MTLKLTETSGSSTETVYARARELMKSNSWYELLDGNKLDQQNRLAIHLASIDPIGVKLIYFKINK